MFSSSHGDYRRKQGCRTASEETVLLLRNYICLQVERMMLPKTSPWLGFSCLFSLLKWSTILSCIWAIMNWPQPTGNWSLSQTLELGLAFFILHLLRPTKNHLKHLYILGSKSLLRIYPYCPEGLLSHSISSSAEPALVKNWTDGSCPGGCMLYPFSPPLS